MKRVFGNRLRQEARKFAELQQCIAYLEDLGSISKIFDIVYNVCHQEKLQTMLSIKQNQPNEKSQQNSQKSDQNSSNHKHHSIQNELTTEEILKENLKLIMTMIVDEIWKNYDSYVLQKKVLESKERRTESQIQSQKKQNKSKQDLKASISSTLNRDFIEPTQGKLKESVKGSLAVNYNNQKNQINQQNLVIDDFSSSDISGDQSMLNPATAAAISDDKENFVNYGDPHVVSNMKCGNAKQVFAYNTAGGGDSSQGITNNTGKVSSQYQYNSQAKRRHTENHHFINRLQSESELIFSQFQTPHYKASEIGNPISSPHTDERDSIIQMKANKAKLLAINLLSQENSAKCEPSKRKTNGGTGSRNENGGNQVYYKTTLDNNYQSKTGQKPNINLNSNDTMHLDDLEFTQSAERNQNPNVNNYLNSNQLTENTPKQHLEFNNIQLDQQKLEEIMLKNIWEIENNPLFNQESINEEENESSNDKGGFVIQQMKQANQHPFIDNKKQEDSTINGGGKTDRSALRYNIEEAKDSMEKLSIEEESKRMNLDSDENQDDEENIYMEMGYLTNQILNKDQQKYQTNNTDNISEIRVPLASIDGQIPSHENYQPSQGIQSKITKLNTNQQQISSQPNLLFQFQNAQDELLSSQPIVMDQEYLKSIPKTGRDHYSNKNKQQIVNNTQKLVHNNFYNTTQDSNSLMLSSDQPTKISAEEVIRNYTNANFIPQKQANDRLHLLCQSRELNPLVSLSVENDDDNESRKLMPQTARVHSAHNHLESKRNTMTKEAIKSQQLNTGKAPKYINQTQNILQQSQSRSNSRSKTPNINRPGTVTNAKPKNIGVQQQCYTQQNLNKKDDSVNESKFTQNASNNKITHSAENTSRTRSNHQILQKEGRYIVNKLAKVIKSKGTSSTSRNNKQNQNVTQPLNINPNFLATQSSTDMAQTTYLGNISTQNDYNNSKNLDQSTLKQIMMNTTTNAQTSLQQSKTSLGFISQGAVIQNRGNQTTKFQQFTLSQRTDSQQSLRSTGSSGVLGLNQTSQNSQQMGSKLNRFGMRRFTADPNDESSIHNKPLVSSSAISATAQGHINNPNSNLMGNMGQYSSSKNLNQTTLTSNSQLPPHQRSMVHLHHNQGTVSPSSLLKQMKKEVTQLTNGQSSSQSANSNNQKILNSVGSHKNIIQNTASAQAIIYGKLIKKQRKKIDLF